METLTLNLSFLINASSQKVWTALTDPEMVKQYFFGTKLQTTWKVGDPITFSGEWEGKA
ncbi:MAG: SRPBCC domain-containing protein, partial [Cyclobacteriaceae bacterium]